MGICHASCSFTRFRLTETPSRDFWAHMPDKLKQFAFRDIDEIPEDRSLGWVCFEDMLDTQWHTAPPDKGEYFLFSLRLDTRRVPAGVIKKHVAIALRAEKKRNAERDKHYISRERKKELREQVLLRLKQRFLPVPAEFNVVWNTRTGHIWLASTQQKMIDAFAEYFMRTFELPLEQLKPYELALAVAGDDMAHKLDSLQPTTFMAE